MVARKKAAGKKRPVAHKPTTSADKIAATMAKANASKPSKERRRATIAPSGSYFVSGEGKEGLEFFSSGCAVLDEILGGGWCLGRTSNVVGDKSAGKTLLAMEAVANFCLRFPDGEVRYAEAEAAFDMPYAGALGIPLDRITFNEDAQPMATVEALYDDLEAFIDKHPGKPKLYIVDSLDSLSTESEMEADFNEKSYGGEKPKAIGQLFRRLIGRMEKERMHFMVVSQLRDVLNAKAFQETKKRSGGKALDFYATWILWIAEVGKIKRTVGGIERITGIDVRGKCKKNKIGLPLRECDWPVLFGYGIDDMKASVDYLVSNGCEKRLDEVGLSKVGHGIRLMSIRDHGGGEARMMRAALAKIVRQEYSRIETSFLPKSSKY